MNESTLGRPLAVDLFAGAGGLALGFGRRRASWWDATSEQKPPIQQAHFPAESVEAADCSVSARSAASLATNVLDSMQFASF